MLSVPDKPPDKPFCHILSCERDTIYKKADRILENKMGFAHKEISLKEALKRISNHLANHNNH